MALQFRRGTAANRTADNFTPVVGEPIFETDTNKLYIGDGSTVGGVDIYNGLNLANVNDVTLITETIENPDTYSIATNVVTLVFDAGHSFVANQSITIANSSVAALNGTYTVTSVTATDVVIPTTGQADIGSTALTADVNANIVNGRVLAWDSADSAWKDTDPNAALEIVGDTSPQLGGNLDTNGNDIVSTGTNDIDFDPAVGQNVVFRGNATDGSGRIVLNCEQNTHAITIQGPAHAAAANYTLVLPTTDGDANQYLVTDGSGNLSWQTPSSELLYTRFRYNSAGTPGSVSAGSQLLGVDAALGSWSEMTFANNATNGTNIGSADFNPTLTGINTTTGIFDNIPVGVYRIDVALQLTINNLATNSYLRYNHLVQARNGATVISAIGQDFNFTTTGTAPGSAVTQDVKYSLTVHLESTTLANNDVRILLDQDQGPDYFCSVGFITFTKIA